MDIYRGDLKLIGLRAALLVAAPFWVSAFIWVMQNPVHWFFHDFLGAVIDPIIFQVLFFAPATVVLFGAIFIAPLFIIPDRMDPQRKATVITCMAHPFFALAPAWLFGVT